MAHDKPEIQRLHFVPGQRLLCSTGRYSGYYVHGCYEVLRHWDTHIFLEYRASVSASKPPYSGSKEFLAWLVVQGYIRKMPTDELFLGEYGEDVFMLRRD